MVEPFVPEGQYEREFTAIEPNVGYEPTWIFEVTEPMGWKGAMTNRLLLSPRGGAWSDRGNGDLIVSGCLWFDDPETEYCGLIAQLEVT